MNYVNSHVQLKLKDKRTINGVITNVDAVQRIICVKNAMYDDGSYCEYVQVAGADIIDLNVDMMATTNAKSDTDNINNHNINTKGVMKKIDDVLHDTNIKKKDAFSVDAIQCIDDEFDFEANLKLFDKERIWKEIREKDTTPEVERLVSHNKALPRKMKHYENVLGPTTLESSDSSESNNRDAPSQLENVHGVALPHVSAKKMIQLYDICCKDTGPSEELLVEASGRSACEMALMLLGSSRRINPRNLHQLPKIIVCAGRGFNGAVAVCAARHLSAHDVHVTLALEKSNSIRHPSAVQQLRLYSFTNGELCSGTQGLPSPQVVPAVDIIIDGIKGFGATEKPCKAATKMIKWCNASPACVLSLDVPSGITTDGDSFEDTVVMAKWILMFGLPKTSLLKHGDIPGSLFLADIGIPAKVYERIGISISPLTFGHSYFTAVELV